MSVHTTTTRETLPPKPVGTEAAGRHVAGEGAFFPPEPRPPHRTRFTWGALFAYLILVLGGALLIIPFLWMVKSSLSTDQVVQSGQITASFGVEQVATPDGRTEIVEVGPQWHNYVDALSRMGATFHRWEFTLAGTDRYLLIPGGFPALANTVFVTALSIVGQILSCSLVGYGFARFRFRGRGPLFILMLSTMMLPPQVTMIPVFLLFRSLGMVDTFWPLILPMWLASPFFVFMFRQFFAQVPEELMEAARIDGASNLSIYWRLMLPLSGPVIAIVAIYTFMTAWNDFLTPLIYLDSPENRTLALALSAFRGQYGTREAHLLMAASFITMLPCILLFFAAQRYFVQSVATSGLKG